MRGYGVPGTDTLSQVVSIPNTATYATLELYLAVSANDPITPGVDTFKVEIRDAAGIVILATLATYDNTDTNTTAPLPNAVHYGQRILDVTAYIGQTVTLYFEGKEGAATAGTQFSLDEIHIRTDT